MINYYLILIVNFIGIGYLILFLIGFFSDNLNLFYIGGIGMLIFMFIIIKEQPKNLFSFLFMSGIGCAVAYFVSKWWSGLFLVSAFYTIGQLFGIRTLIKNKEKIKNLNLANFAMSGMVSNPDEIKLIEIPFYIVLIIGPYLLANYIPN